MRSFSKISVDLNLTDWPSLAFYLILDAGTLKKVAHPIDKEDPYTGRIDVRTVISESDSGSRTIADLKKHLQKLESITRPLAGIFAYENSWPPMSDDESIPRQSGEPGTSALEPLFIRTVSDEVWQALSEEPILSKTETDKVLVSEMPKSWKHGKVSGLLFSSAIANS